MQMEIRRVLSNWMDVTVRIFLGGIPAGIFLQLVFNLKKYPLWVFYDPAYPYLYNGVVIIQGGVPRHTDHPGTSLQWISGIVSKLTHVLRDNGSSLSEDVVAHSELYLRTSGIILSVFFCLSLCALGFRMLKYMGGSAAVSVVVLISAGCRFWNPQIFILTPESLVITTSTLIVALLVPSLVDLSRQSTTASLILVGVLLAIGLTSKVILMPILLTLPFIFQLRQLAVVMISLVTSSALILTPVYSRIYMMYIWFTRVATQPSRYGGDTSVEWSIFENLRRARWRITENSPQLMISFAAALVLVLVIFVIQNRAQTRILGTRSWQPSAGLLVAIIATFAMGYKPSVERDFVLLVVLIPTFVSITIHNLQIVLLRSYCLALRNFFAVSLIILIVLSSIQTIFAMRNQSRDIEEITQSYQLVRTELTNIEADSWIVYSYGVPSLSYASNFGNAWTNRSFNKELDKTFPRYMELNIWNKTIYGSDQNKLAVELDCLVINERLQSSKMFMVIIESHLNEFWPQFSGSLELSSGSLDLISLNKSKSRGSLFEVRNCTPNL